MGLIAVVLMLTMVTADTAAAQSAADQTSWPDRPIHWMVPFSAGSNSDVIARLIGQKLGERLHQTVVIENRPGASGALGTEAVVRAAADGYTLGLGANSTLAFPPDLTAKPPYNPVKDFAPISMIGASPLVLAVYPGLPVHHVQELIALAKTKPGALTFAEAGPATLANLAGILFNKMANVQLTPVSYRGSQQEVLDIIEGRVDMQFGTIPPTLELIRQGKLRAIAVTGARRSPILPDVPTIAESGLTGYETILWQALYAPAATPEAILARLNTETNGVLHQHDVVDALSKLGFEVEPSTQQALADRIATDQKKWRDLIAGVGIKAQ